MYVILIYIFTQLNRMRIYAAILDDINFTHSLGDDRVISLEQLFDQLQFACRGSPILLLNDFVDQCLIFENDTFESDDNYNQNMKNTLTATKIEGLQRLSLFEDGLIRECEILSWFVVMSWSPFRQTTIQQLSFFIIFFFLSFVVCECTV